MKIGAIHVKMKETYKFEWGEKMKFKGFVAGFVIFLLISSVLVGCTNSTLDEVKADTDNEPVVADEEVEEDVEEEEPIEEGPKLLYVKSRTINLRAEANKSGEILLKPAKWTELELIEEVINEEDSLWYKVKASKEDTEETIEGYVLAEDVVEDKIDLLKAVYPELDYSPIEKVYEYPNNPRVEVKGIYLTKYSAAGKRIDELIEMANRTEINTFVIDVKDDKGDMLFYSETAQKYAPAANNAAYIKDMEAFMQKLRDNNIYAIARIVCFKDNKYADAHPDRVITYRDSGKPFTNSDKLVWVSAYDRDLWNYNIGVAKEAAKWGFNEIQFDYVRFPASAGGKLDSSLNYRNHNNESKPQAIQEFLKQARRELSPLEVYISADIYGMVGTTNNDMGLGQYWEAVSNVVDYVSPMKYPSHYGNGEYGLKVPDAEPYKTIYYSTRDSVARNKNIETPATIRPWIQDFTASWVKGYIRYGEKEIREQIRALNENGVTEYMLWNARNRYTEEALIPKQ